MNKFITYLTCICACLAMCNANPNDWEQLLQSSYGNQRGSGPAIAAAEVITGPTKIYAQPQIVAPVYSQVAPAQHAQIARPLLLAQPAAHAHPAKSQSAPRYTVQAAGVAEIGCGQNKYRTIASPPEYSQIVLPVRAAQPVAKLFVPQAQSQSNGYNAAHSHGSNSWN